MFANENCLDEIQDTEINKTQQSKKSINLLKEDKEFKEEKQLSEIKEKTFKESKHLSNA